MLAWTALALIAQSPPVAATDSPPPPIVAVPHKPGPPRLAVPAPPRPAPSPPAARIVRALRRAGIRSAICAIMRRRARFTPATDSRGMSVVGRVEQEIEWRLREGPGGEATVPSG